MTLHILIRFFQRFSNYNVPLLPDVYAPNPSHWILNFTIQTFITTPTSNGSVPVLSDLSVIRKLSLALLISELNETN